MLNVFNSSWLVKIPKQGDSPLCPLFNLSFFHLLTDFHKHMELISYFSKNIPKGRGFEL